MDYSDANNVDSNVALLPSPGAPNLKRRSYMLHFLLKVMLQPPQSPSQDVPTADSDDQLGTPNIIEGWNEGIATMKVGGKRKLTIPPALAYKAFGKPPTRQFPRGHLLSGKQFARSHPTRLRDTLANIPEKLVLRN